MPPTPIASGARATLVQLVLPHADAETGLKLLEYAAADGLDVDDRAFWRGLQSDLEATAACLVPEYKGPMISCDAFNAFELCDCGTLDKWSRARFVAILREILNADDKDPRFQLGANDEEPEEYTEEYEEWYGYNPREQSNYEAFYKDGGREGEATTKAWFAWDKAREDRPRDCKRLASALLRIIDKKGKQPAAAAAKPKPTFDMTVSERKELLLSALAKRGLAFRADSRPCDGFINLGFGQLDQICDTMEEMSFLFAHTLYNSIKRARTNSAFEMRKLMGDRHAWIDLEQIDEEAKVQAATEFIRAQGVRGVPASLELKIFKSGDPQSIRAVMEEFKKDRSRKRFGPIAGLNSFMRREVHLLAQAVGLKSMTEGGKKKRVMFLEKYFCVVALLVCFGYSNHILAFAD